MIGIRQMRDHQVLHFSLGGEVSDTMAIEMAVAADIDTISSTVGRFGQEQFRPLGQLDQLISETRVSGIDETEFLYPDRQGRDRMKRWNGLNQQTVYSH